jgi:hypothetical protein
MRTVSRIALLFLTPAPATRADENSCRADLIRRKISDRNRPEPPVITHARPSPRQSPGKAPSDALVFFDGMDPSKWQNNKRIPYLSEIQDSRIS